MKKIFIRLLICHGLLRSYFLDEVTYIKDWDKTIKYIADAGMLEQTELILTGSEITVIQEARMRFPGRRGKAKKSDFHLYPLSFREVVEMKKTIDEPLKEIIENPSNKIIDKLFDEFNNYLKHGGYLTAINDMAVDGHISISTLNTYSDWIRGDILKRGKQEHYLREILSAIIKRYNSQITWNALTKDLSIDHPATVADYSMLLEIMDVLFIQYALLEDKLTAAPKKARKLLFTDPFIFHAIRSWLYQSEDPYKFQICESINDPKMSSKLVESCVANLYHRKYSTYYIKAEGEVDIAYVNKNRFYPVEIKWTNHLHHKDIKQITKYKNSIILTKSKQFGTINNVKTIPLPLALMDL